ncbi:unnamed protein product, partial [Rotaria sp. Silwood2]
QAETTIMAATTTTAETTIMAATTATTSNITFNDTR